MIVCTHSYAFGICQSRTPSPIIVKTKFSSVLTYELSKIKDESLVCVGNLCDDLYGIGFRKGEDSLMNAVYGALVDMAKDGTAAKIAANWFSTDIVTDVLMKTAE